MTISFSAISFRLRSSGTPFWLYLRFTLSYRDVEDLLAERGVDVSYETVQQWVLKFGPLFAQSFAVDAHGQRRNGISMRRP